MAALIPFTSNYTDVSTYEGYQFEFHCQRCGNGYRSAFRHSVTGFGGRLAALGGGILGGEIGSRVHPLPPACGRPGSRLRPVGVRTGARVRPGSRARPAPARLRPARVRPAVDGWAPDGRAAVRIRAAAGVQPAADGRVRAVGVRPAAGVAAAPRPPEQPGGVLHELRRDDRRPVLRPVRHPPGPARLHGLRRPGPGHPLLPPVRHPPPLDAVSLTSHVAASGLRPGVRGPR